MSAWGRAVAWGKTGRVRVDRGRDGDYNDVYIDGVVSKSGNVDRPHGQSLWRTVAWDANGNRHEARHGSFDAAVLWVLRRVDPALWRQERGEVGTLQIADDVWMLQAPGHPSWTLRRWPHDPAGWTWGEALSALINETKDALR